MIRAIILAALALAGCIAAPESSAIPRPQQPADDPALSYGGLNQDIRVGRLTVRPLAVSEDSRCPADVTCVWSGQLVLRARVSGMAGLQTISTIRPLALPGGRRLELAHVWPPRMRSDTGLLPAYRFGFRIR
jgi:hypothetical protein